MRRSRCRSAETGRFSDIRLFVSVSDSIAYQPPQHKVDTRIHLGVTTQNRYSVERYAKYDVAASSCKQLVNLKTGAYQVNPLTDALIPQNNGLLYSNMVIGTPYTGL